MAKEMAQDILALETLQEHFLVIAGDDPHVAPFGPAAGEVDHAGAFRSAINEITQQDHRRSCRCSIVRVLINGFGELLELRETSVNIADCIDAFARRNGSLSFRLPRRNDIFQLIKHRNV